MSQLDLPFAVDPETLQAYLTRINALEDEQDRLREDARALRAEHTDTLPLRAIHTALKVVRARRKLAAHAKEPVTLEEQALLEAWVERHLDGLDAERQVPAMWQDT